MDICHPFLCNWVQGVARTSREGDRDEQAVGAASSTTLRNGACLVGAGERSHPHPQPGGPWLLALGSLTGQSVASQRPGGVRCYRADAATRESRSIDDAHVASGL